MIVGVLPLGGCQFHLPDSVDHAWVEQLIAGRTIKPLNIRVLLRIARLDKPQRNTPHVPPISHLLPDVLWPVVTADDCVLAPPLNYPV